MSERSPFEVADAARPTPPRRRWLKRAAVTAGLLGLALIALRWWWGSEAERRLQAKIAEYRAAGQPVLAEDFALPPVPDDENAAVLLRRAADLLVPPADSATSLSDFGDPEFCREHAELAAQLVRNNAETLALVRAARDMTVARWGTVIASPLINIMLPHLAPQRDLAKLLVATAVHQHQTGDDAAAVESIRDVLALAGHVEDGEPVLFAHLVRVAIDALAAHAVEIVSPKLRVVSADDSPTAGRPVPRETVQALIAELLDERSLQAGGKLSLYGERLMQLDSVVLLTGRAGRIGWPALLGAAWKLDGLHMAERMTRMAEVIVAENWPTAVNLMPPAQPTPTGPARAVRLMSAILEPSLERAILIHFRLRAERHMAATALAVRLFELDHGRRPAALAELVPDYLASIPTDPFHADNAEIRYLPDAPSPLLYSIGPDGADDGGRFKLGARCDPVSGRCDVDGELLDCPFFLNGDRPRPPWTRPPATETQPASDPAMKDDGGGEEEEGNEGAGTPSASL